MHVALLANTAWLDEELHLFQHLVVGLIDEGVRVAQVVPEGRLDDEASVFGEVVYWRDEGWAARRRHSLASVDQVLEGLGVNLIHALDGRLWRAAALISRRNNVPAVYSSFSSLDLPGAARFAGGLDPTRASFSAASEPLAQALRGALPERFGVELFRTGIHKHGQAEHADGKAVSVVIAGDGQMDARMQSVLESAAALIEQHPDTHLFFDGQGEDQRGVWRAAQKQGLLSHSSFIPRRLGHRELLMRADVLALPQPNGRVRGLMLQAMAHGLPVLAADDAYLDDLIDGQTARVLKHTDAGAWRRALIELVASAEARRTLGASARQWVNEHRRASASVAQAMSLYRVVTGASLPFTA